MLGTTRAPLRGAVAAVAGPGLVTLLALTSVSPSVPRTLYIAAIALAALAGLASGLAAAVLSFVAVGYFFTPPRHSFAVDTWSGAASLAVFLGVAVLLGALVARERRSRARSDRAAAQTRRLEAVARALTSARTPQQVLDALLTEGLAAAEARAGMIGVLSEDGAWLEVLAHRGYADDSRFDRWGRFRVDEQLPLSEAVRAGVPVFVATTAERNARYPLLANLEEQSHALVCLPLVAEGRTLGGLVLSFPHDQEFDAEQRALKEALAAQVAQALDRARLDEAEREARERLAFLAEASALLSSSLDYGRTLKRLTELCVPRLGDWCAIDMVAPDGQIERLAIAHADPEKVRLAEAVLERFPHEPDGVIGVPRVIRTGEPELVPELTPDIARAAAGGDEERLRATGAFGMRSRITVPLVARGRTLGSLSLLTAETPKHYTRAELELAVDLAHRAATAIDNSLLHREAERRADAARALDHVDDAVLLVDGGGSPRYWNAAADALLGAGLRDWPSLRRLLPGREWPEAAPVTVPVELATGERWLEASRSEFEEGAVYAVRDVTDERLLERTRSEFVATASHELRTPIAAIYGAFQTLLRDDVEIDPSLQNQFLRIGLQESERLRAIVEDLLVAGELDAGAPQIERGRCDVAGLVSELADSTIARIDGSHRVALDVDPGLGEAECDARRLRQVLANLLENAVKYSPDGGMITVSAARDDGRVRIEVSDEGIGIPGRDQARVFERFVRLDPDLRRGVGGTGLGLYICRELVTRMNGRISVRSREGEGSTFVVELPA